MPVCPFFDLFCSKCPKLIPVILPLVDLEKNREERWGKLSCKVSENNGVFIECES